jgi:hypothetical protein
MRCGLRVVAELAASWGHQDLAPAAYPAAPSGSTGLGPHGLRIIRLLRIMRLEGGVKDGGQASRVD